MAGKTILSENQRKLLKIIGNNKNICQYFYLTGGTALAEFYLHHRLSEDLDFFSEEEIDSQIVFAFLKSIQKSAGIKKIDAQEGLSFSCSLAFLTIPALKQIMLSNKKHISLINLFFCWIVRQFFFGF